MLWQVLQIEMQMDSLLLLDISHPVGRLTGNVVIPVMLQLGPGS